jgi:hypothetical protein
MEKMHDKINLAGDLLIESARECRLATTDVGYAKSILLSGAVSLMITPLLEEYGIESLHMQLAKGAIQFNGIDLATLPKEKARALVGSGIAYYRFTYNSLKHAGLKKRGKVSIKASEDLTFFADLKEEAFHMVDAAIHDFNRLPLTQSFINTTLSDELLDLLNSPWNFPALDVEDQKGPHQQPSER